MHDFPKQNHTHISVTSETVKLFDNQIFLSIPATLQQAFLFVFLDLMTKRDGRILCKTLKQMFQTWIEFESL